MNDLVEAQWFLGIPPVDLLILESNVGPGDWVIDVGAHAGIVTEALAKAVGPTGKVWSVEPVPANTAKLRRLVEDNHLANVSIFECALTSAVGTAKIRCGVDTGSPYGSFTASWIVGAELSVKTETLDSLVADEDGRIAFIKIDVEGAEPALLEGAAKTLSLHRPRVVCEFNDIVLRDTGASSRELLKKFISIGYSTGRASEEEIRRLDGTVLDLLLSPV